ncbi:MAG: hypothetical protein SCALA702_00090 [Melioribacteraceae bacterium]|nr:MAG: hypothetical protein SCALA702_00090 [Melioribacteraceae bacterium]
MKKLLSDIAEIIKDYRKDKIQQIDSNHVQKWVEQFDKNSQKVILQETKNLLSTLYISENSLRKLFNDILVLKDITDGNPKGYWKSVSLLDIQSGGSSQKEMNKIFLEEVDKKFNFKIPKNDFSKKNLIYLDDFLFTGNRALNDFKDFLPNNKLTNIKLEFIFMGWYRYGQYYFGQRFEQYYKELKRKIDFRMWSYQELRLENRLYYKNNSESFWMSEVPDEFYNELGVSKDEVKLREVIQNPSYRFFSSETNRQIVEEQFLKYGVQIISNCESPSVVMRPLGFSPFRGFGFGSVVTSFRNCPNNCPLVFWWGDITKSSGNALDNWYPLLPRKVYKKDIKVEFDFDDDALKIIYKRLQNE